MARAGCRTVADVVTVGLALHLGDTAALLELFGLLAPAFGAEAFARAFVGRDDEAVLASAQAGGGGVALNRLLLLRDDVLALGAGDVERRVAHFGDRMGWFLV